MPRVKSPETLFNLGKHFAVSNKRILRVNACARAGLQRQYVTWPLFSTRDHSGEIQDPSFFSTLPTPYFGTLTFSPEFCGAEKYPEHIFPDV
jgi:hypothetical protein